MSQNAKMGIPHVLPKLLYKDRHAKQEPKTGLLRNLV